MENFAERMIEVNEGTGGGIKSDLVAKFSPERIEFISKIEIE